MNPFIRVMQGSLAKIKKLNSHTSGVVNQPISDEEKAIEQAIKLDLEQEDTERALGVDLGNMTALGGVIDASQYAYRGDIHTDQLATHIEEVVEWINFKASDIEPLGGSDFRFNDRQRYWLELLRIPYKRQILRAPQVFFETLRLYTSLAIAVDEYLIRNKSSLNQLRLELNSKQGYYDNILYTLECISEYYVSVRYLESSGLDVDFSMGLLDGHIGTKGVEAIKGLCVYYLSHISAPNDNTKQRLGLNDMGVYPFWWDSSGKLRTSYELKHRGLFLLKSLAPRSKIKLFQDEDIKLITVKLYFQTVDNLLQQRDNFKQQATRDYLGLLSKKLADADQQRYLIVNKDAKDREVLTPLFKLIESCVRQACGSRSTALQSATIEKAKQAISNALGAEGLGYIESTIESYERSDWLRQLNLDAWKQDLKRIKNTLNRDNIAEKVHAANGVISAWADTGSINQIYHGLAQIFAKHHPVTALFYYYKYSLSSGVQADGGLDKSSKKILHSALKTNKQRGLFQDLLHYNYGNDHEAFKAIHDICLAPRHKIRISSSKQKKIKEQHDESRQALVDFLGQSADLGQNREHKAEHPSGESLNDIFADKQAEQPAKLDRLHVKVLQLLMNNDNALSRGELDNFARQYKVFPSALIERINQFFYDHYSIHLIQRRQGIYSLSHMHLSTVKELVNANTH